MGKGWRKLWEAPGPTHELEPFMTKKQLGSWYNPKKVPKLAHRCVPFWVSKLLPRASQVRGAAGDVGMVTRPLFSGRFHLFRETDKRLEIILGGKVFCTWENTWVA